MLRKAAFASFAFSLLFLSLLTSTREARADAIIIHERPYTMSQPVYQSSRDYIPSGIRSMGKTSRRAAGRRDGPRH